MRSSNVRFNKNGYITNTTDRSSQDLEIYLLTENRGEDLEGGRLEARASTPQEDSGSKVLENHQPDIRQEVKAPIPDPPIKLVEEDKEVL